MVQVHRITQDFISHRWREHPFIVGAINYHIFRFMVPLSTHNKRREEVASLKCAELSRQSEISKLVTSTKTLEFKSKRTVVPSCSRSRLLLSSSCFSSLKLKHTIGVESGLNDVTTLKKITTPVYVQSSSLKGSKGDKLRKVVEGGGDKIIKVVGRGGESRASFRWVPNLLFLRKLDQ